ncbi:MAG: tRNA glutamyl-Q(34) synthetase GluQRS [Rhodospirillaceae bacterium]|nr:tRNA glutamyl-Q(34) synthetase GluQRS [Rhodospirillaceae bacterium]
MVPVITRFAPSPTGYMHLGHAFAALFAWTAARESGGRFMLRIEDIDPSRCRPEFETAIYRDLEWLGIDWDGPVRRQSDGMDDYGDAIRELEKIGLAYPCFCTRSDIRAEIKQAGHAPHGPDGIVYPGTCRGVTDVDRRLRIARGEGHAIRIDMAKAVSFTGPLVWYDRAKGFVDADPLSAGDVVLARKDVPTSYHLASVLDDHLQGVTLVTRGNDLFHATHVHRALQALLHLRVPEYHHHALITDANGIRLAKRNRAMTLRSLRQAGKSPAEVRAMVGFD